ncbi:MAG TPA: hypothetical protein VKZ87_01745 [Ferrovibrio sp.]|jgi:hypothetical protein|uniref:hypothetical protein n=1 Tax=Ferrovibrio sp. TaxID=1917215 RepID=UPI002B4B7C4F|nr:hypothetical protein [Ferrovibrio sp.]HLT76083.1 hypothetical protein [Ferrovibrio sp.]
MARRFAPQSGAIPVLLADSITEVRPADAGSIVISGSHGGSSATAYAVPVVLKGCFFNDAGIGKESAGIAGLGQLRCPAAAYSHDTARIGDAADGWQNGVISAVNDLARDAGLSPGMSVHEAVKRLLEL